MVGLGRSAGQSMTKTKQVWPCIGSLTGTWKDHQNTHIRADETSHSVRPRLILPASNVIEFTTVAEETPWPDRPQWEAISIDLANSKELKWRQYHDTGKRTKRSALVSESERK